jgi:hypothetical protein
MVGLRQALKISAILGLTLASLSLFLDFSDLRAFANISATRMAEILLAAQLVYVVSGVEFAAIIFFSSRTRLSLIDIFVLPISMNLWSFLIPFQGSLVYSTLILRYKYRTGLSDAVSTTLFAYTIAIVATGMLGLLFVTCLGYWSFGGFFVSLCLMISPFALLLGHRVLAIAPTTGVKGVDKTLLAVRAMLLKLRDLLLMKRLLAVLALTNIAHIAASFLMNVIAASALNFSIPWHGLLAYTLLIRLSVILKVTPGNIGVQEVLSGGIFSLLSLAPDQGVMLTLLTRVVTIVLMSTVGVVDSIVNTQYFPIRALYKERSVEGEQLA